MKRLPAICTVLLLTVCVAGGIILPYFSRPVQATPYWTEEDYLQRQGLSMARETYNIAPKSPVSLDAYAFLFEYVQICDFLVSMQEHDTSSSDYGGMHEGESPDLWAVVETDNTQEAIRVWSTYAEYSGDLETYRENIEAAWVYTMNYPAYNEEGAESDYYRVHNCGWALVAESKYRQVYSDDSYLWYADSCASYIQTHRLGYSGYGGFYDSLHPLVEGWAAGTLYDYGIEQGDPDAVDYALEVGEDVKNWIEADTTNLSANEVWAMSGGTALWGVCRSIFTADPGVGALWLPQQLPYMDTYAGPGEWNNSWNVWYAHAYHAAAAVLNDPLYTGYAFALVDTLLDADTDDDGGIMATSSDPPTEDQSWVSCYLNYMGLSYFIDEYPPLDATALAFLQPDTTIPIASGEPHSVIPVVANSGFQPFGNVDVQISGAFSASGSTYLDFADVDTLDFGEWVPADPGWTELTMTISPSIGITENDTLIFPIHVLGWGEIQGSVTDASTGNPISGTLYFYLEGLPSNQPLFEAQTDPISGTYQIEVYEGTYRAVIDPELPYTDREVCNVEVALGGLVTVNFELTPAPVLLVDDDEGALYDTSYSGPLTNAGYDVYIWEVLQNGAPGSNLNLFDAVVWLTGDATDSTLTTADREALAAFLDQNGNLLISGQNVAEDIAGDAFLADYLGVSFDSSSAAQQQVVGISGDPVTAGMMLTFPGAGGAGNQTSTDKISAAGPGVLAMQYAAGDQPGAAVRVENGYKSLFLGFGLEGVSGVIGTTRPEFLTAAMDWFEVSTGIEKLPAESVPRTYSLMTLAPNPFNPEVHIRLSLPHSGNAEITIYNLKGQLIESLNLGRLQKGTHQLNYQFGNELSSGVYLFRLKGESFQEVIKGVLLK